MVTSRESSQNRWGISRLLLRLPNKFRSYAMERVRERGYLDARSAHLQIWENIGIDGIRLTDLAGRADLSLPACSELTDQLEDLGYLERRPDPSDGRAKLISPTGRGRALLDTIGEAVGDLEAAWEEAVGSERFEKGCTALHQLLAVLGDAEGAESETWMPRLDKVDDSRPADADADAVLPEGEPEPTPTRLAVFSPGPRPGEFRIRY